MNPIMEGRVVGGMFHGDRPIRVARDRYQPGIGLFVLCRACAVVVSLHQPDISTACSAGLHHLATVDHSIYAMNRRPTP
jgi:hypothetical protein